MDIQDVANLMLKTARRFAGTNRSVTKVFESIEEANVLARELESDFTQVKVEKMPDYSWRVSLIVTPNDEKFVKVL